MSKETRDTLVPWRNKGLSELAETGICEALGLWRNKGLSELAETGICEALAPHQSTG